MVDKPAISPLEVVELFCGNFAQTVYWRGWTITMDGPMMSPRESWAPVCEKNGVLYFVSGMPGDPVTRESVWVLG